MTNLKRDPTQRTPEIEFDFAANRFVMRGESYPEDINDFYGSLMLELHNHLTTLNGCIIHFTFELIYFNSSSAKVIFNLFELLDEIAKSGNDVNIIWVHDVDDDNMHEMGIEFAEDLKHARYQSKSIERR
ncbi:MAG: DUF1987 domain-containing protein [Hyphomicrobiales bacterium]|nr:DUF1987 domain-containing protein [Hyphomicrobiales bacterium]